MKTTVKNIVLTGILSFIIVACGGGPDSAPAHADTSCTNANATGWYNHELQYYAITHQITVGKHIRPPVYSRVTR
ncbi:hypothetical protein [Collimonas sp.]|jgi:hypothetical protein|uniref:hypothetical protein n=1 Tax=Collimonas sp. TaxID=1963772 RepID=UPI002C5AECD3|nr:hypothetical protein [Collimonas sp.]HWW04729.1 hypothetical protein [Collimonas sp.]